MYVFPLLNFQNGEAHTHTPAHSAHPGTHRTQRTQCTHRTHRTHRTSQPTTPEKCEESLRCFRDSKKSLEKSV